MVSSKLGKKVQIKDRNDVELKQVEVFCYLRTSIEEKGGCSKAVRARIGKARQKWRDVRCLCAIEKDAIKNKGKDLPKCD